MLGGVGTIGHIRPIAPSLFEMPKPAAVTFATACLFKWVSKADRRAWPVNEMVAHTQALVSEKQGAAEEARRHEGFINLVTQ